MYVEENFKNLDVFSRSHISTGFYIYFMLFKKLIYTDFIENFS